MISTPKETEMSKNEDARIEILGNPPANSANDGVVQDWERYIRGNETTQRSERKRQIEKVPRLLLKGKKGRRNRQYYKPAVISLGPYNHNRKDLAAAEKYKLITLEEYRLSCRNVSMGSLYNKVFEVVQDARKCYIDGSTDEYTDEQFNRIMVHDGCFVLFFIDCIANGDRKMMLNFEYLGALGFAHVIRDIFLLENQIPFIVLQVLLDLRFPDRGEESLNALFNYLNYGKMTKREEKVLEKKQPLHLLELYRANFISLSSSFGLGSINSSIWRRWRKKADVDDWNYKDRNRAFFVSIMELKAKGIFVKRSYDESSNEDIKFHSRCCYGELELRRRVVHSTSKAIYLNLIAYEMCPHNPNDFRVSTYIRLMKALVAHRDDVKELVNNKILFHRLGRDEEVVKMYNEIDTPAINLYMYNQLDPVIRSIERHCNNKYKTWAVELINVYFSNPWKTMSLLVGTAILFTSFLQTYFTIRPLRDDSSGDLVKLLKQCVHSKPPSAPT